jgi:tRNA threonylcarbamoyladenosine biosynthesis protein TsaB
MSTQAFRVLAFDTSAQVTSLAICQGQGPGQAPRVLIEQHVQADNRHAETLLPSLKAMLEEAHWSLEQIHAIGVGVGPGSFTGVRVGVATAKGLGLALQKPVFPVVSLDALAHEALTTSDHPRIAACLDAFKGELFCAVYAREGAELRCERAPFHGRPEAVRQALAAVSGEAPLLLVGAGVARYAELLADAPASFHVHETICAPRARIVAELAAARFARGEAPELAQVAPIYLRDSDAQLPKVPLRL